MYKIFILFLPAMVLDNLLHITAKASHAAELLSRQSAYAQPILFIVNFDNKLEGTLTDAEIRQGLANGLSSEDTVDNFINREFFFLEEGNFSAGRIREHAGRNVNLPVPVLDEDKRIVRILDTSRVEAILPVDVLLMAGGKGRRLMPLTKELPKPLLKVGDKTLLEHNLDRLIRFGIEDFHVSVHYQAYKVSDLLGDGSDRGVHIRYVMEDHPIGTIGALGLVSSFSQDTILVMNADLLTLIDFEAFYQDFLDHEADISVASCSHPVSIPFGVLDLGENKEIRAVREKPNYTYHINAGIYLIRKEWAKLAPPNEARDATELIQDAIQQGAKVVSFPLLDYWLDIGNLEDYERAKKDINYLDL